VTSSHRNRLADEPSLYLRQHGSNPVDWYPWGEEALARARDRDQPILLSIGYSACHWCHVMERESFENEQIARQMNELFVCIKVDREERPDLDHLYMKAVQGMTGHGGWPMTVFLTPDGKPFYAGTYFPPEDRGGMPGLPRVLAGVAAAYRERREEVTASADRVAGFLRRELAPAAAAAITAEAIAGAAESLVAVMDADHGGFGQAPKFPGSMALTLLMDADASVSSTRRRDLLRLSLDRMADGGIHDHLGGGFHRYSVDRQWLVPHFEKMLYDQALLARMYADASAFFHDSSYGAVAAGILDYVLREMTSPEGGFYATQDADSEGVEGKFFVWSRDEIVDVVGAEDATLFCRVYGVTERGNFEGENILHRAVTSRQLIQELGPDAAAAEATLTRCRKLLFDRRATRVAPGRDEKIVSDWNGLMISAMAAAGQRLQRPDFVQAALAAIDFVRQHLLDGGRLRHVHAQGQAKVDGFLDDYAFFGRGCLDAFAAAGRPQDLQSAQMCADVLLERFEDPQHGGFYFTAGDGEPLVARTRDLTDGAIPAGNSVAAELLLRLWELTGTEAFRRSGQAVIDAFAADALRNPYGAAHLLCIADRHRQGWISAVVVGDPAGRAPLQRCAVEDYLPALTVICLDDDADQSELPPALRDKRPISGRPTVYVCRGTSCSPPAHDPVELVALLEQSRA